MKYCPVCLNDSLRLQSRGVVEIIVNGKQRDNGRFLFNSGKEDKDEILDAFEDKLEDFFKWYSDFQNQEPINNVQLLSGDFACENGCQVPLGQKFSVIEILLPSEKVKKILDGLGNKYNMKIELEK